MEPQNPDVLELRVHGVANTPPAQMLDLTPAQVEQVDGDELGSFWAPTPAAGALALPPGDPRVVPAGVRREAYSWGAMARFSTLPGLGRASGVVAGVVRALWVLIAPFGFVNVAYWARDADEPAGRRSSAAGGLVRLFGLALTLLWTATAASVALGLMAAQCYGPRTDLPVAGSDVQYVAVCSALPGWLDSWARWSAGGRTAAYALLAVAAIVLLALVGATGRVKYERRMSTAKAAGRAEAADARGGGVWPMLARPGFWTHARKSSAQALQHLAAAFTLLAVLLAWHFLYRDVAGCAHADGFGEHGCLDVGVWSAPGRLPWAVLVGAGLVVLVVVAWRVAWLRVEPLPHGSGPTPPDRVASRVADAVVFVVAVGLLSWALVAVAGSGDAPLRPSGAPDDAAPFLGLAAVPRALVALMVLLVLAALGARARVRAGVWAPLVVGALACASVGVLWPRSMAVAGSVAGALAVALVVVVLVAGSRRDERRREGWGGRGPAVLLSVAAGVAMVLSSATVLGVASWLSAPAAAENAQPAPEVAAALADVAAADPLRDPVVVHAPATEPTELLVPPGYGQFAVASVLGIALFVLLLLVVAGRGLLSGRTLPVEPGGPWPPKPSTSVEAVVQRGRRQAALAQRGERIVGALGWLFFGGLVATLALPDPATDFDGALGDVWDAAVEVSTRAVVLAFGLLVTSVVVAGSKQALARPWGLLWDLMCFLPRAAHPFAPPCYAERVVPELRARIDSWLGDDGAPVAGGAGERERRRVVLSAHSLGGVVAVATLFGRWDGAGPYDHRVGLLTYGTQLRAYFGRFFPELLGPGPLGTRATAGPRLWAPDPWGTDEPGDPDRPWPTLVASLTTPGSGPEGPQVRWRNLWRRTDFIGFPVDGYAGSAIDAPADEVDEGAYLLKVAAHGGYPRARQYADELGNVVGLLRSSRPRA